MNPLNSKLGNYLQFGSGEYTVSESNYGFIDSGISSADYMILCAYTLLASNNIVLISNTNGTGATYRFQLMNGLNQSIAKSGTYRIYYIYIDRSKLGS